MFKKGQLVRSVKHGWKLVVMQDEVAGKHVLLASPIRLVPFRMRALSLVLIGNNYRAKHKCSR